MKKEEAGQLLGPLIDASRRAGAAVIEVYRSDFAVTRKADASPVTEADIRSERVILDTLAKIAPMIPVVSEEAFAQGKHPETDGGTFWLVDPLDGTKEFVKRNGEFTVNIGLILEGRPCLGVIYAPVPDLLFAAQPGLAWVEDKGAPPTPITARFPPRDGMVALTSRSHRSPGRFDDFIRPLPVQEVRQLGSSLKLALIAAGKADLYPRFGRTMEWDTAAGHAILDAAGGRITSPEGAPLVYGKNGFENTSFVAWGRC
ncbi:MAG: 3'(2'),5'-bisphosphate nucleotidase CysQ [Rhodospirillaceae bacterium]|nr:3'(2'),5'-bisphosphate nucleotidase CysQ [Rhodospirillaceae bacterium]